SPVEGEIGRTLETGHHENLPRPEDRLWVVGCKGGLKPIEEGNLRCLQPSACLVEIEPFDAVDLGECQDGAGMRWPLDVVGVAHGGRWVEVSLNCPPQHALARLLCDLPKIDERMVGGFVSGFFRELT